MDLLGSDYGDEILGVLIFLSVLPLAGLEMATDRLVAMGLPRVIVGPIVALLLVAWVVGLFGFVALRVVDWG